MGERVSCPPRGSFSCEGSCSTWKPWLLRANWKRKRASNCCLLMAWRSKGDPGLPLSKRRWFCILGSATLFLGAPVPVKGAGGLGSPGHRRWTGRGSEELLRVDGLAFERRSRTGPRGRKRNVVAGKSGYERLDTSGDNYARARASRTNRSQARGQRGAQGAS